MEDTGIGLFVYKRRQHTQKVLEGLKKNNIKKLYIFSDGPREGDDPDEVLEVRTLIKSIDWCETQIIENEKNKGLAQSLKFGYDYILQRHERIVVFEDDTVPSADCIAYMNRCLDHYEDNEKVLGVTAFAIPVIMPEDYDSDVYCHYRVGAWCFATWRRAWALYEKDFDAYERIHNSKRLKESLRLAGSDLLHMFKQQIESKIDAFYIWWDVARVTHDGVYIHPIESRIQNIGNEGSGTNCSPTDKGMVEINHNLNSSTLRFPKDLKVLSTVVEQMEIYHNGALKDKIVRKLGRLVGIE